jgi:hypothetical protein
MKRDNVRTIRDEAEVYAYLNRIRDGRTVSVAYVQHPHSTVCWLTGRWVGQDLPTCVGWRVNTANAKAIIMPTDKIKVFHCAGQINVMVILAGRRIPRSAATVRRARIAGIIKDDPPDGGDA